MIKKIYQWQDEHQQMHYLVSTSKQDAILKLISQKSIFFNLNFKGFFSYSLFKKADLATITKQIAIMIKSGFPLIDSLNVLKHEHSHIYWRLFIYEVTKSILGGESLYDTLKKYPFIFTKLHCEIIAIGELTGDLSSAFDKISNSIEQQILQKQQIKKALRYPLFLLITAVLVTVIMLLFILPEFQQVYAQFDTDLPAFTTLIIKLSAFLKSHLLHLIFLISAIFLFFKYVFCKIFRYQTDKFVLLIPLFGKVIHHFNLVQIFQTLAITQISGISLLSGINAAKKSCNNLCYQLALQKTIQSISAGSSFYHALHAQNLFPNMCLLLIHVGEESSSLEITFEKLSQLYEQQNQTLIDSLLKKIEPTMMSIMAIIIGGLVIAMYLPVFQLGNAIH